MSLRKIDEQRAHSATVEIREEAQVGPEDLQ